MIGHRAKSRVSQTQVQTSAPPFILVVTWGKQCPLSEPRFPHSEMEVVRALPQRVIGSLVSSGKCSAQGLTPGRPGSGDS